MNEVQVLRDLWIRILMTERTLAEMQALNPNLIKPSDERLEQIKRESEEWVVRNT